MKKYSFVPILVALLLLFGHASLRPYADRRHHHPRTHHLFAGTHRNCRAHVLDADHDALPALEEGVSGITFILANVQSGTTDAEGCYRFNRSLVVSGQLHRISWSGMHPTTRLIHDPDNGTVAGSPISSSSAAQVNPLSLMWPIAPTLL